MKNCLVLLLVLVSTNGVLGMELTSEKDRSSSAGERAYTANEGLGNPTGEGPSTGSNALSVVQKSNVKSGETVFSIPELRLLIMRCFFRLLPANEAVKAFKAFLLINRASSVFFKANAERTANFVKFLDERLYWSSSRIAREDFLKTLSPLGSEQGIIDFDKYRSIGLSLEKLFKECAQDKQWDKAFQKLHSLGEPALVDLCINYQCKGGYNNYPAKKTLLVLALELGAPKRVIQLLLNHGSPLNSVDGNIPPAFLVACKNYFVAYKKSCDHRSALFKTDLERTDEDKLLVLNSEGILQAVETSNEIVDLLVSNGASVHKGFHKINLTADPNVPAKTYETPLSAASGTGNLEMVSYVLKKGIRFVEARDFMEIVLSFIVLDKGSLDIVRALASTSGSSVHLFPPFLLFCSCYQERQEKYLPILSILLEQEISMTDPIWYGMTILDMAWLLGASKEVKELLMQKSATESPKNEKTKEWMCLFNGDSNITFASLDNRKPEQEVRFLLNQINAVLSTIPLKDLPFGVVCVILDFASGYSEFSEAKELVERIAQAILPLEFYGHQVTSVEDMVNLWNTLVSTGSLD